MLIKFRYPDTKNGHMIEIRNNAVTGVRSVLVDGDPAEKLTATIYSYTDVRAGKTRKIEVINIMLGNPRIEIDGKDMNCFPEVPMYEKILLGIPFLRGIVAGVAGFFVAALFLVISLGVTRSVANRVLRVLFLVVLAGLAFIAAIYLNTLLMPLWEVLVGSSSSSPIQ
jgi:hypothetical protein